MLTITTKPGKKYRSLKRPDIYEALRRQGMSKQRAARISNAQANKDAGTVAGPMLSGPGGLLGTPGMGRRGRKWGNRRKNKACSCGVNVATKEQLSPGVTRIRGNLCNVHGRYGPCDASKPATRKPKGKKGRTARAKKPVKTPEQRAQERQQAQTENRSKVLSGLGIGADGQAALEALRSGQQPNAAAILSGGFEQAGLVERAADGSYRLTASGRAAMAAAAQGDQGRAGDIISAARDRLGARQGRQAAAEQRKQEVAARRAEAEAARKKRAEEAAKKRGGGGKQSAISREGVQSYVHQQREAERQADRERRLAEHQQDRERRLREHEEDRARRNTERTPQTQQRPAQRATAPPERVSGERPGVVGPSRKRGRMQRSNVGIRTKSHESYLGTWDGTTWKADDPGDYLVVEDRAVPSTYHLQVKKNGMPDHRLMGAAWAALHGGYRGNKYQGPNKQEALAKLKRLYEREGMPLPSEKAYKSLRVVETGGDTIAGNATAPEAYAHAAKYGEISQSWLQQLIDQGYVYQVPDNGYALYEMSELVAKKPELQGRIDYILQNSRPDLKSFTVFKSADGSYRWIARTTTAYRDRDGEIITTKALETDAARMTATGQYGPLRYWHLGMPDPFDPQAPWGQGVDIGDCDYSTVIGRTSIESGTFKSAAIGAAFAQSADDYELSPGFFHPVDQPNAAGEYGEIRRFERSVVPIKYGRASNLFTGMTVKEHRMDANEYERRMKAFAADMNSKGVPPEVAGAVVAGMEQADKSAQAQGVAYKADDPWQAVTAALKAAMAPASMEEAADTEMGDALVEQPDEGDMPEDGGEYIGDMSPMAFKAMMGELLAPVLKVQDMVKAMTDMHGELKGMMGGAATKSTTDTAEIATLKAAIADATKRLALLEGDQPAVVTNADVEAALKGAPQAPPDPNAPIVPKDDPSRPYAEIAARTFPNLYRQNPDGSFGGWQVPQSNS